MMCYSSFKVLVVIVSVVALSSQIQAQTGVLSDVQADQRKPMKSSEELTAEARMLIESKLLPLAKQVLSVKLKEYQSGMGIDTQELFHWSQRIMKAEHRLAQTNAKKHAALKDHHERVQGFLAVAEQRYRAGQTGQSDVLALRYYLAEIDVKMSQAKKK